MFHEISPHVKNLLLVRGIFLNKELKSFSYSTVSAMKWPMVRGRADIMIYDYNIE